jgi:hypothetical protein
MLIKYLDVKILYIKADVNRVRKVIDSKVAGNCEADGIKRWQFVGRMI